MRRDLPAISSLLTHALTLSSSLTHRTGADLVTNPALGTGHFLPEEVPFDKAALGSRAQWCTHIDMDVISQDPGAAGAGDLITLRPACGIGRYRDPDGLGAIGGYAARGGRFVRDGLVTAPDRWNRAHYLRKRRFRFVGDQPLDASGDVRAFVLAPSPTYNRSATPRVETGSCSIALGCGTASPLLQPPLASAGRIASGRGCSEQLDESANATGIANRQLRRLMRG